MTLEQIKQAIDAGKKVQWKTGYEVIKDNKGQYFIVCNSNKSAIGLTWADDITLNGKEEDFTIKLPVTNTLCVKVSGVKCNTLTAPCDDLQQAKEIVQQYIQLNDLGGSTFKGAIVYHPINGAFCHISYNGRVWEGTDLASTGKKEIIVGVQASDIIKDAKFKTSTGIVWIIDNVENDKVDTSMEHGKKGNYRDDIKEVVAFLNEEKATKI